MKPKRFDISERKARSLMRESHNMSDKELLREGEILQEFLGDILRAVTSPLQMLKGMWSKGVFTYLGKKASNAARQYLGTQRDVDRKAALEAFSAVSADMESAEGSLSEALAEYLGELEKTINFRPDRVFPKFGEIDLEGEEKKRAEDEFISDVKEINESFGDLVTAGARVRGIMRAMSQGGDYSFKVSESPPIDEVFPLSYVKAMGSLVGQASSLEDTDASRMSKEIVSSSERFVKRFTPALKLLTDRLTSENVARAVIYSQVISERSRGKSF